MIPKALFNSEKTNRPTIYVHVDCNSVDKSKDDNWFSKTVFYKSLQNPTALARFTEFIDSAERSRTNHVDKTTVDTANEKLLRTILNTSYETGLLEHETREKKYVKMLARGLIIRNSWYIKCDIETVLSIHRPLLTIIQNEELYNYIEETFLSKLEYCIYQFWDNDILYVINPKENQLYLEFYGQLVYLIGFDYELPTIVSAKKHITDEQLGVAATSIDANNKIWQR